MRRARCNRGHPRGDRTRGLRESYLIADGNRDSAEDDRISPHVARRLSSTRLSCSACRGRRSRCARANDRVRAFATLEGTSNTIAAVGVIGRLPLSPLPCRRCLRATDEPPRTPTEWARGGSRQGKAGAGGLEPPTSRLTAGRSAIDLHPKGRDQSKSETARRERVKRPQAERYCGASRDCRRRAQLQARNSTLSAIVAITDITMLARHPTLRI